jgi:hypothetical protein
MGEMGTVMIVMIEIQIQKEIQIHLGTLDRARS